MTNYIQDLLKYDGFDGYYGRSNEVDEIECLLYNAGAVQVEETFEEGGRWSNYVTTVWKVEENGNVVYFAVDREVPATEMQEGGEFSYQFHEVVPKEVIKTIYVGADRK